MQGNGLAGQVLGLDLFSFAGFDSRELVKDVCHIGVRRFVQVAGDGQSLIGDGRCFRRSPLTVDKLLQSPQRVQNRTWAGLLRLIDSQRLAGVGFGRGIITTL